mmetsp:Transcript_28422/g.65945  ORF Transcript_28422/g.65945 Transcript_28422/m.65945 type:complete len:209 (-) Transcript_28422:733-1359(-)
MESSTTRWEASNVAKPVAPLDKANSLASRSGPGDRRPESCICSKRMASFSASPLSTHSCSSSTSLVVSLGAFGCGALLDEDDEDCSGRSAPVAVSRWSSWPSACASLLGSPPRESSTPSASAEPLDIAACMAAPPLKLRSRRTHIRTILWTAAMALPLDSADAWPLSKALIRMQCISSTGILTKQVSKCSVLGLCSTRLTNLSTLAMS